MVNISAKCPKMLRKVVKRLKSFGQESTCLESSSHLANSCSYLAVTQPDVFIETIYEDNDDRQEAKQAIRRKRIGDQMAMDMEEVFSHYFGDVAAFVRSTCKDGDTFTSRQKAYKRLRELQHTKHFLTRMINFYEGEQNERMQQDGLERFMDVYFSSLYDLVLSCIRIIQLENPELSVIGKRPSFLHTSSTTFLSKRTNLAVCREEEEDQYLQVPNPYEPILSAAPRVKNDVQRRSSIYNTQNNIYY